MTHYFTLTILGNPKATPRHRATVMQAKGNKKARARAYMPSKYVDWKSSTATVIARQMAEEDWQWMKDGARVSIEVVFVRPQKCPKGIDPKEWKAGTRVRRLSKPDCDNLWKGVVDAMTVAINEKLCFTDWDDCMAETGPSNRWYAAIGEEPSVTMKVAPLDSIFDVLSDMQHANAFNYAHEGRRALKALERHIPAGDIRWQTLIATAEKLGVNIPLTA